MDSKRITPSANKLLQNLKSFLGITSDKDALSYIIPHYNEVILLNNQLSNELQVLKLRAKMGKN